MTVASTTSRVEYAGDGSSTAFSVPYYFLSNADLVVLLVDADGISTTQVLTTNYTVTGAGVLAGGTVTMLVAPPSGNTLIIYRDPAITQLVDYAPNDPFPAETHERALDRLTMIAQRLSQIVSRAFRLADSDTSGASLVVPSPVANRAIKWSSDGLSLVNSGTDPDDASAFADDAAASAAAAAASAADAATIYDNFDDRYLGSKAADPIFDNDGNALLNGALYWNTVSNKLRIYNGSAWQDTATASPASFTPNLYNGTGAQTAFTLTTTPASSASVVVSVSGVLQRPTTDYSVSGTTLTFVAAPPLGTNNVLALVAGTVAAGTPDNDSVSTAKIQDGAVTSPKLGGLAVLTANIANEAVALSKLVANIFSGLTTITPEKDDAVVLSETSDSGNTKNATVENVVKAGLNATGSAPVYGCRAWVNFNGTGTVAIRASGNVSSITDNGTGDYTVNFTTALPDANYTAVISLGNSAAVTAPLIGGTGDVAPTTTALRFSTNNSNSGAATDCKYINVAIFR